LGKIRQADGMLLKRNQPVLCINHIFLHKSLQTVQFLLYWLKISVRKPESKHANKALPCFKIVLFSKASPEGFKLLRFYMLAETD
jgi:hypothetical protein